jgi:hypothetical protein
MTNALATDPGFWALILGAGAILLWWHDHHWTRFTAWLFAGSAACFAIAIPQVFDALAALTATPGRLAVLALLDVAVGFAFYLQAVRTHSPSRFGRLFKGRGGQAAQVVSPVSRPNRHKPVLTNVVAILFGPLLVITIGSYRILSERVSTSAAGTLKALAESAARVNDGSAAHAIPAAHLHGTYITLIGVVLGIGLLMRIAHKRKGGKRGRNAGAGRGGVPVGVQSR